MHKADNIRVSQRILEALRTISLTQAAYFLVDRLKL
jgi:hypothetical protein